MSLLIGDIGGTTSRWAWISPPDRVVRTKDLPGYNPTTGDPAAMQAGLRGAGLEDGDNAEPLNVIVYGAGCGTKERAVRMHAALTDIWPGSQIEVKSDLLGAARALYGNDHGLVLILGTGMNAGHYDGTHLHLPMPSLGHVLGDEGSGADIGKHLLRDALYGQMPADLVAMLFPNGMDLPSILERIHRSAAPQAYLASFTARLADQLTDTYAHDLIVSRFFALTRILAHFFSAQEYQEVRAIGSVAFGFQGILQEALAHRRMNLTSVQHDPMPGLVKYHAVAMR